MLNVFAYIGQFLGVFKDLPMVMDVIGLIHKVIVDAEATGESGDQKLTAVLNDVEAFLAKDYPQFDKPFIEIAGVIEEVVRDIVSVMNLFKKAAPAQAAGV